MALGESEAMEQCIASYGGLVWSIAHKYSRSHSDAEDLVQEIFTALWRCASRFDESAGSETTFIGMLARRRAIDWLRKQGRRPDFEPLTPNDAEMSTFSHQGAAKIDHGIVMSALERLPEETQELFRFHFERGLSHSEIADQTGMPLGTVKTRLRSGLLELRTYMKRLEPQPNISL
ncbi:MAG: RNA polymerase subunit sigma-24 [Verrucomicrobiales bacterium]|nr:RNA polymerase subunit sigma-24 [Verrucomicrobiales bacterium]